MQKERDLSILPSYSSAAESEAPHRIVGYLPDWNYQPFSEFDLGQLTHINIAFCNPNENGRLFCYIPDDKLKSIVSEAHSHDVEVFAALGGGGGCSLLLTQSSLTGRQVTCAQTAGSMFLICV
ncbi:MAG: hypothetical protein IKG98_08525 [Ruminococcus sp.]|nr:hypothetical protein [Ruminococcus sp.]